MSIVPGGRAGADEYYVGYLPTPPRHLRFIRVFAPAALWLLVVLAAGIAWTQRAPGAALWDLSQERTWEGTLRADPYPMIEVEGSQPRRALLLVEQGKLGAARAAALDGRRVRARGWLLERDGRAIVELSPEASALEAIEGEPAQAAEAERLGVVELSGEIMDSKCFLGAMKPGDGRAHRACAQLCIRGGIPPVLVTRDIAGTRQYFLLCDERLRAIDLGILPNVGIPVKVRGELLRRGEMLMLATAPDRIERIR